MNNRMKKTVIDVSLIAFALCLIAPDLAHAGAVGAGGLPYSPWIATFSASITGEIAQIICLICVIAITCSYAFASAFDGILLGGVRTGLAVGLIGSAAPLVASMAAGGAII